MNQRAGGPTWWVYMLDCDGRLYTGVTTDPERRLRQHRSGGARAARFTRGARSIRLRYAVALGDRSLSLRAEHRIKRLSRADKNRLIASRPDAGVLLARLGLTGG